MKKMTTILVALCVVAGLRAEDAAVEAPASEAFKVVKAGLVAKTGDATELVMIKEEAVKDIEQRAGKGEDIKDALDYVLTRVGFDPSKKAQNEQRLKDVLDRLKAAAKKSADAIAARVAKVA